MNRNQRRMREKSFPALHSQVFSNMKKKRIFCQFLHSLYQMDTFVSRIIFHMLLFYIGFFEFNSSTTIAFGHKNGSHLDCPPGPSKDR
jgi:hypothetical protein